jgi:hypothetical protein
LAAKTGTENVEGLVADDERWAHRAPGPYLPMDRAPMLVGNMAELPSHIQPVAGKPLTFTANALIRPESARDIVLIPFFRVHDSRYMLYWRTTKPEAYADVVAALKASEQAQLELDARTVDYVAPGEQQPEVDHGFAAEGSNSGMSLGRHWRDASGWFSYQMRAVADTPLELIVTYHRQDHRREFEIFVNNQLLATVNSGNDHRDQFMDVAYPVPAMLIAAAPDGKLTVKFVAKAKSRTASIYGVRLAKVVSRAGAPGVAPPEQR